MQFFSKHERFFVISKFTVQNIDSMYSPIFILIIFEVMAYRSENNPELKSINLSLKLLNGVTTQPSPYFRKSISSLQQLSSRINMANQSYNFGRSERQSAKEWYIERGVNLSSIQEIAREVKKKQRVQQISKIQSATWEKLEYEGFDDLSIEDFLHQNEERVALYAVMNSFSTDKPSNHMDKLRTSYINSLTGKKTELLKTKGEPTQTDGKQMVSQFVRNYRLVINQIGPPDAPVHKIVEKALSMEKSIWLRVLYHQVELIEYLGREQTGKRNHILIISLKQLEKINSKKQLQFSRYTRQAWKTNYEKYRKGKTNFELSNNDTENELIDDLITIQQQINNFQEISINSTADLNKSDSHFLRRLKLIALGKYEQDTFESDLVSQSWMLIIALGLKRKQYDEKQQRSKFRKQVKAFTKNLIPNDLQSKEQFEQLLASLISLGAFQQIISIYQELNESSKLTLYFRSIFIQLFIILAFNAELIEQFSNNPNPNGLSRETKSIVQEMIVQIAQFSESYKQKNTDCSIFITIIASIIYNLEKFNEADFQILPQQINKVLRMSVNDFFTKDCGYLPSIASKSKLVRKMLEKAILNARIQSDEDYLSLAELCKRFQISNLIQHIFLRYVILHQIDSQGTNSSENVSQTFVTPKPVVKNEDSEIFQQIIQQLNEIVTTQNVHILHFITCIIQLKDLIKMRKVDELNAKRKGFELYIEDQRLLPLLSKLCQKEGAKLMDIYVNYYQQLRMMYKLIFFSNNNIFQLRRKYTELGNRLESLQKRYPAMKTQRVGRFIAELYQ